MRYADFELLDRLAREYVVGTLRGRARTRFAGVTQENETARRCVRAWEERLLPLTMDLAPVAPHGSVWQGIESRLDRETGSRQGAGVLQRFRWAIAAMIALVAVGLGW